MGFIAAQPMRFHEAQTECWQIAAVCPCQQAVVEGVQVSKLLCLATWAGGAGMAFGTRAK
jgi:hypothetical protein